MNEANSPHISVALTQWARQESKMGSYKQWPKVILYGVKSSGEYGQEND